MGEKTCRRSDRFPVRMVCGFLYVKQSYEHWRVVRQGLRFLVLIPGVQPLWRKLPFLAEAWEFNSFINLKHPKLQEVKTWARWWKYLFTFYSGRIFRRRDGICMFNTFWKRTKNDSMNSKKTDSLPRTNILQVNPSYNYCKSRLPQKFVPLFKQR